MRPEYSFAKSRKNPYAKQLKQQVTILLDREALAYFKALALDTGVPYQLLINLYLKECARKRKRPTFSSQRKPRKAIA